MSAFSTYTEARALREQLVALDDRTPAESIEYLVDHLTEAATRWLTNVERIRSLAVQIERDLDRTIGLLNDGYNVDVSNRLGQRATDYEAAVSASAELARLVVTAGQTIYYGLGQRDDMKVLLDDFVQLVFERGANMGEDV